MSCLEKASIVCAALHFIAAHESANRPLLGGRAIGHPLEIIKRLSKGRHNAINTFITANRTDARSCSGKCICHSFDSGAPICYSTFSVWAGRFRLPLAVTRKFRLCLHPSRMLRTRSILFTERDLRGGDSGGNPVFHDNNCGMWYRLAHLLGQHCGFG